jgi:hypothetical protein
VSWSHNESIDVPFYSTECREIPSFLAIFKDDFKQSEVKSPSTAPTSSIAINIVPHHTKIKQKKSNCVFIRKTFLEVSTSWNIF